MMEKLTVYEKFVLIVQATSKIEALSVADNNILLIKIIDYLDYEYHLYDKKH